MFDLNQFFAQIRFLLFGQQQDNALYIPIREDNKQDKRRYPVDR